MPERQDFYGFQLVVDPVINVVTDSTQNHPAKPIKLRMLNRFASAWDAGNDLEGTFEVFGKRSRRFGPFLKLPAGGFRI